MSRSYLYRAFRAEFACSPSDYSPAGHPPAASPQHRGETTWKPLMRAAAGGVITGLRRVSKPGLRVYAGAEELPRVLRGLGIAI
ncbi:30S ribosomal protein S8, partial [Intestinimonas massiliensis (ex Afouda et al. 2020)]|uniref:helix-turn-helix transcriptional regulator n=1 Tax=Intestinimonas massiliensis (ex Afouda et al. 2020) TaxID=1673721 RepID=UPI003F6898D9